ncbi:antitoxin Xre/MbcA/ParS toxin-binding domain-containing protein [Burkholderia gladioli]|uniref:antitoxin Xre/MbcA/ParS toxin-binding domain-containing protein n=1 Tax=Burkholderia gladioli TaxID=28095 RepID=UPI001FC8159C|nr:antitoxin Xre/MbcA/ParS toxin-binding domain-containing protein [Burkholderia gladioli]
MRVSLPGRQLGKRVTAMITGSDGLGASTVDIDTFRRMAPLSQRRTIVEGFDAAIVERVARELLDISVQAFLRALSLSTSTIRRKMTNGDRLSLVESDRVARVLYVLDHATEVFGARDLAAQWMTRAHSELDGLKPIEVMDVQPGYDRVRNLLNRAVFALGV